MDDIDDMAMVQLPPSSSFPTSAPLSPTTNPILGFLAFANASGGLKAHFPAAYPALPSDLPPAVSYKQCLRNHAACIGGHALDGCCEFMPSLTFHPSDPIALVCSACGCHRSFHRPHHHNSSPNPNPTPSSPPTPAAASASPPRPTPASTPPPKKKIKKVIKRKNINIKIKKKKIPSPSPSPSPSPPPPVTKRFRTKFSKEQKRRMYEFSEEVGWKLQKVEKAVVEEFCEDVGVEKEVLRIWMNNNKYTFGRKREQSHIHGLMLGGGGGGGRGRF